MRLLALVPAPYDTTPGLRYRIELWAPLLNDLGVEITFQPFKSEEFHALLSQPGHAWRKSRMMIRALARRRTTLRSLEKYDAVYIYNEAAMLGPPLIEYLIHRKGIPFVFDFDDAIFVPYAYVSPANGYFRLLKFPTKTRTICRLASHVIVGNPYLYDYAIRFNDHVTIVPSTVDTERYTIESPKPTSEPPIIGWTGSYSTVQYLNTLRGTLQHLARRERFRLRVIGVPDYKIDGVDVEALPWNSQTEVEDLRPVDVGIMPMPDDRWTRGKCGMKALQYMALGIPAVCSPVGINSSIIRDQENGFLAATEEQWIDRLTRLLHSAPLREQMGQAGRRMIETDYSATVHAHRVFNILKGLQPVGHASSELAPASRTRSL